ncbi:MAG: ankyrin repeat domain-containing protein [Pirellulales bacterium]|nr:ankyrin repeat domain-containing protein [Pirellulales bacterium]
MKPTFDNVGPQVGEQLPDLRLTTLKGEVQQLGAAWHSGPALIVTSSFTCPKSRSRWPELAAIARKYEGKLNVVVVYVIEAHPVGSICPYKNVEDVTPENHRDGILRKQPTTMEDRLELAQEFKRYLRIDVPIHVDPVDNRAWKALGAAPNIAFLVDKEGIVTARQGWFEGPALEKSIEEHLKDMPRDEQRILDQNKTAANLVSLYEKLEQSGFHSWDLTSAIREEKTDKLAEILSKFPEATTFVIEPAQGHPEETTLLMDAVAAGNLAAAEFLLKHGADIHARTGSFDSPLQAADFNNLEMVKLLLKHKANVNFPVTGKTPLHEALLQNASDGAELLIAAGAREDFYSDIGLGKLDKVKAALAADPSRAARPDGASRMPLDYAAANDQLDIVKLLIEHDAPIVDASLAEYLSPLHYAIKRGNVPIVELLLKSGHSPNTAQGRGGDVPRIVPALHMAISGNQVEIVKLLLAQKVDLTQRNDSSQTPLHFAAILGSSKIAELLIKAGADVNATVEEFSTGCGSGEEETPQKDRPLHFAAARGNPDTIKVLIAAGADIHATNVRGETPLMSALTPPIYTGVNEETQLQNMELLLRSGADVNAKNNSGKTVLDLVPESDTIRFGSDPEKQQKLKNALTELLKKHGAKSGS